MENRKFACLVAASLLSVTLTASATSAFAGPPEILVEAPIKPELQRTVSYRDLNLAERYGQKTLVHRIYRTASNLCSDLNGSYGSRVCTRNAVDSTDDQVAQAIDRAKRQMAGLAVGPAVAISMVIGVR